METKTQVLVVGAGPVGLMTAIQLKRRGIDVKIVDQAEQESVRSFAVVLHPRSVEMLAELGVVEPLRWQGHSFKRIAVFANSERRALLTLPVDGEYADGGLTLPQNVLRRVLESVLRSAGVAVEYGRKLASVQQRGDEVHAWLTRPPGEHAAADAGELKVVSDFLIGADGFQSAVRARLGIAMVKVEKERPFVFFDVPHAAPAGATAEFAFGQYAAAMYPLRGGSTRYSFELPYLPSHSLGLAELSELRRSRMRWHSHPLDAVEWSGVRSFQPALADRFGRGRVWLVGDACHVASPIGAQSLNVGLREARELTETVVDCLHGRDLEHLSTGYAEQRRLEWRRLLAIGDKPSFASRTPAWATQHFEQFLSCLPASRDDLDDLLEQLGICVL
ncbi:MAG TPA: NAD(P)/FAD-dependent oxidoreductase [Polyangiaceae bacterium]|nr:NAD(P)/FAD-dependent oxidoreductase [Polyangiaceae bacterium]